MLAFILAIILSLPPAEPPLLPEITAADLEAFPPAVAVADAVAFADAHIAWLKGQAELDPQHRQEWDLWLLEATELREPWSLLEMAYFYTTSEGCDEGGGLIWPLTMLRDNLGAEAYYAGRLPACVPLWRFRRAD